LTQVELSGYPIVAYSIAVKPRESGGAAAKRYDTGGRVLAAMAELTR